MTKKKNATERMHQRAADLMSRSFDKLGESLGPKSEGVSRRGGNNEQPVLTRTVTFRIKPR